MKKHKSFDQVSLRACLHHRMRERPSLAFKHGLWSRMAIASRTLRLCVASHLDKIATFHNFGALYPCCDKACCLTLEMGTELSMALPVGPFLLKCSFNLLCQDCIKAGMQASYVG